MNVNDINRATQLQSPAVALRSADVIIYLYYPKLCPKLFSQIFGADQNFTELKEETQYPIFLDLASALRYGRCMGKHFGVLKLSVCKRLFFVLTVAYR